MASLWYRTGTITLTQGSALVTGVGTTFFTSVRAGDMLIGPIMDMYEITDVISDGQMRIDRNYEGVSYTGTDWSVAPTAAQLKQLAKQITELIAIYQDIPQVAVDAAASAASAATAATQAVSAATSAASSKTSAASSESAATASASAAASSETNAAASAVSAAFSKSASAASESNAAASAAAANSSASSAATSATNANASKVAAASSAQAAAASAESIAGGPVTSVNSKTGIVVLNAADVGLGNVTNVTPANLPVSTAAQTALNSKVDTSAMTTALAAKANLATSVQKTSNTGAAALPAGTNAERPAPDEGNVRFNRNAKRYEGGNGTTWASLGGAMGGGNDDAFYENTITITAPYVGTPGKNAMSAGPIIFAEGGSYSIPEGSTWIIN